MRKFFHLLLCGLALFVNVISFAGDNNTAASAQAQALKQAGEPKSVSSNTNPAAQWFPDAGLGLFIHWGLAAVDGKGDLSWAMMANKPWNDGTVTPNEYYAVTNRWKADRVNYDETLAAAKAAGFTYAVMVTKHHEGFTFLPSAFGDLGTKYTFGGRDFVREFVAACRKHGLKVGLYYSPPDWWFDREYKSFSMRGGPKLGMDHQLVTLQPKPKDHDAKRAEYVRGQVTELLSNYGQIDLIWFDGGHGEIPNVEVRRLQPGIVINRRNGGGGDYGDSESKLPAKRFTGWFETCDTCWPSHKWSFVLNQSYDTAPEVLEKLVKLRAWGGNLLADVGPMGDGTIPEPALAAWKEMSAWMAHSGESVIGAKAGPWPAEVNAPVTTREAVAYVHFLPEFKGEVVWTNAPKAVAARLLRTKDSIPLRYDGGNLHLAVPESLRTTNVDVVKLELSRRAE